MAGTYRPLGDGLFEVDVPGVGRLPMAVSEQELQQRGLSLDFGGAEPPPRGPDMRLADSSLTPQLESGAPSSANDGGVPARPAPPPEPPPPPSPEEEDYYGTNSVAAARADGELPVAAPRKLVRAAPGSAEGGAEGGPNPMDKTTREIYEERLRGTPRWSARLPARDDVLGYTEKRERGPGEEEWKQYIGAREEVKGAHDALAEHGSQAMAERASTMRVEAAEREYEQIVAEHRRAAIDADIAQRQEGIKKRREEWQAKASEPYSYWKDKGAAAGVFSAIAAALGAYGASLTGTRNFALDILNDAVDRETAAHNAALQNEKEGLDIEKDELGQLVKIHGDPRMAMLEFKIQRKENAALRAEAEAMRSGSQELLVKAKEFRAAVDADNAELAMELSSRIRGAVAEQHRVTPERVVSGGGPGDPLKAMEYAAKWREAAHKAGNIPPPGEAGKDYDPKKDPRGTWVNSPFPEISSGGWAPTEKEGIAARKKAAGMLRMEQIVNEALDLRGKFLRGEMGPTDMVRAKFRLSTLRSEITKADKEANELGALDKGVLQLAEQAFGDVDGFFTPSGWGAAQRLKQTKENMRYQWKAMAGSQLFSEGPPGGRPMAPVDRAPPPSLRLDDKE